MKKKRFIIIIVAIAIIAVTTVLILNGRRNVADPTREHSVFYLLSDDDENTYVFHDDKLLDTYIAGSVDAYLTCNGDVAIMRAGTGLYRADSQGIIKVYPIGVDRAVLSLDNRYTLFSTATKAHIYDNESAEIIEFGEMEASKISSLVISPNGECFAVSAIDDEDNTRIYIYKDGETKLLRENACIVAISDDGEMGYYVEAYGEELTGKLYYMDKSGDKLIAEDAEANFEINRELNQITFDIDEKTYYSVNGSSAKKLVDASVIAYAGKSSSSMGGEYCTVNLKDVSTIFDCIYYTAYTAQDESGNSLRSYDLYYVNGSCRANKLVGGTTRFVINEAGDSLACLVDGDVYVVSVYNPTSPTKVITNCYTFTCSPELEEFYAVDNYATLKYIKRGGSSVTLLSNAYFVIMANDDTCLCISDYEDNGGDLYTVIGGECSEEPIASNVYSVESLHGVTVYYCNGDESTGIFDVYVGSNGKDFSLALERVQLTKQ